MNRPRNPAQIKAPLGAYHHAVEAPAGARTLYISGQVGVDADGNIPPDARGQLEIAWANIRAILAEADMGITDIVKVTTFITRKEDFAVHPAVRNEVLGDHRAAATAVAVSALATPELLVEVDVVAAASP